MQNDLQKVSVLRNTRLTDKGYLLSFYREFDFVPGQVIGITLDPRMATRLYSIASGNGDNLIEILYSVKDDGELTPRLAELQEGDKIWISRPTGSFRHSDTPSWWIASGTGIAPFLSWLRSGLRDPELLLYGAKEMRGLYFDEDIYNFMGNRYIRCCSRDRLPDCFSGRVTDYLQQTEKLPKDVLYYLCGVAEMVIDAREILISRGVDPRQVHAEIYF